MGDARTRTYTNIYTKYISCFIYLHPHDRAKPTLNLTSSSICITSYNTGVYILEEFNITLFLDNL